MIAPTGFSRDAYREVLNAALASRYRFIDFAAARAQQPGPVCLLRHDIDADVDAALRMAKLEAELGIRATYFFMMSSPVYNLFARANWKMARAIVALGHHAGLHFDHGFSLGEHLHVREWIAEQASFLELALDAPVKAVSFHQPSAEVLNGPVDTGNLINTYSKDHLPGFQYISDSNRKWRARHPLEIFSGCIVEKFQLLIHPMWWMHEGATTEEAWDAAVLANFEHTQDQLVATEAAYGPRRRLALTRND